MAAGMYDLAIEQGSTFRRSITLKDSNDDPIDLTGRTFRGKIRDKIQGAEIAQFTITVPTPADGTFVIELSATVTAGIPVPKGTDANRTKATYIYDVEMVYPNSDVARVIQGKAVVSGEVTT